MVILTVEYPTEFPGVSLFVMTQKNVFATTQNRLCNDTKFHLCDDTICPNFVLTAGIMTYPLEQAIDVHQSSTPHTKVQTNKPKTSKTPNTSPKEVSGHLQAMNQITDLIPTGHRNTTAPH